MIPGGDPGAGFPPGFLAGRGRGFVPGGMPGMPPGMPPFLGGGMPIGIQIFKQTCLGKHCRLRLDCT